MRVEYALFREGSDELVEGLLGRLRLGVLDLLGERAGSGNNLAADDSAPSRDLVASFRSMLDEALEASLLVYVVDAADPSFEAQLEVTRTVLMEIGAEAVPSVLVLNKADRLDAAARAELLERFPQAMVLSALVPSDVTALRRHIVDHFEAAMVEAELVIPYAKQAVVAHVYENARVLSEHFDETGRRLVERALPGAVAKLGRLLAA